MHLRKRYRNDLIDICCRMITTDGVEVSLDERIWMNKLCEKNEAARELAGALLCPDFLEDLQ
tara:strand:- start:285 stop:470 length:186 start_codon:yes stop_codon:yes gene_type:complete